MCSSHLEKHCHSSVTVCMCMCVCVRAGARTRVCDNSLFPIRRLHLNNLFCRNLTLSTHHAYQAHSVWGREGATRRQWNHRKQLLLKELLEKQAKWHRNCRRTLHCDRLVNTTRDKPSRATVKKRPAANDRFGRFRNFVTPRN